MGWVAFVFLGLATFFGGCSETPPASSPCEANVTVLCFCEGGAGGEQTCAADGARYSDCVCLGAPDVVIEDLAQGDVALTDAWSPDVPSEIGLDSGPGDIATVDVALAACDPALSLAPNELYANPYSLVAVAASGGSGAYTFEMVDNQSSGTLNELTGSYLTGPVYGVTDTFRVIDEACAGEAVVVVEVVPEMEVSPTQVELKPGGGFTFTVAEGSGSVSFALQSDGSGASLSPEGAYEAGDGEGDDVIAIVDIETGQAVTAVIYVRSDAELLPIPRVLVLPLGASYDLNVLGGSGFLEAQVTGDAVALVDGRLEAIADGTSQVDLEDVFTGATASFDVNTVPGLPYESLPAGDHLSEDEAIGPGDINGDGYPDAILGVAEAHIDWVNSGGVFIYAGGPDGLAADPVRVISGHDREARFGARLATGDVNGDGLVDLVVGSTRMNAGGTYAGAVYLYLGVDGGFFDDEPAQTWSGDNGYDYFGYSLAMCDYNGDGNLDLAVGAYASEDRDADPVVSTQGGVQVFLGTGSGLSIAPALRLWGHGLNEAGQWMPSAVGLGQAMAAGDMDGDGLCDLMVSVWYSTGDTSNKDGGLYVFRGVAPKGFSKGGLTKLPIRAIFTNAAGDYLGKELTSADYNGDGLVDFVAAHTLATHNGKNATGAVYRFDGGTLKETFEGAEGLEDADWSFLGANANDHEGYALSSGDVNGDGVADLLVGSRSGEIPGSPINAGAMRVFHGGQGTPFSAAPDLQSAGATAGEWYGVALAVLGDVDQKGGQELLVYAARSQSQGADRGQVYAAEWEDGVAQHLLLKHPGVASGQRFGYSVALVSPVVGGDVQAVVAATRHDTATAYNRGAIMTYPTVGEAPEAPSQILGDFPKTGANDRIGYAVASVGDFDGDGLADLAAVLETDYKPGTFDQAMVCGPSCAPAHQGNQGCQGSVSYPGSVVIFAGQADGSFNPQPIFQFYSPEATQNLRNVAGAGDVNGDGLADVVIGSYAWDGPAKNTGGVRLIYGRPQEATSVGKIQVICAEDYVFHGHAESDQMSRGLAGLGDLNDDGCDEFAVGADLEDPFNQGVVRVFFGWDAGGVNCAYDQAQVAALGSGASTARAGYSLAGGHDVDGDGIPDMVVGAPMYRVGGAPVGAAWLVRGSYLKTLTLEAAVSGAPPTLGPYSLASPVESSQLKVTGASSGGELGWSVALIPGLEPDGRAMVALGSPGSSLSGESLVGAALVFRYEEGVGMQATPWLAVGGERYRPGGRFGAAVAGATGSSGSVLLVGAYFGSSNTIDAGSAYVIPLPAPKED